MDLHCDKQIVQTVKNKASKLLTGIEALFSLIFKFKA